MGTDMGDDFVVQVVRNASSGWLFILAKHNTIVATKRVSDLAITPRMWATKEIAEQ
jgi:hypothetical protein